ncbi:TetR/AcrR family transcriptional regulator [Kribbella sindirgiensis]|uniref:TetR/AcrR family transcriptional regulator n=1 Tax=Kribbella sindirgiensis TaxID=1124744 RepID=A0A4R0IEJ9_9ACTN|nr:TetR/AcrR family transcriptional regulator [Kribbella sindirgiensis]TCC30390.1 TetR/AcrR family transcriptional regulator [Kribbella sindirgiensis]
MPRPRTFDEDRAVDAAMRVFWTSGYEATSTQDLCAATGLGRSSIYNTFTSKRDLFDRALQRYVDRFSAAQLEVIQDTTLPIRERVRRILMPAVEPDPGEPAGCFVINTIVELGPTDAEVVGLLDRDHEAKLSALTDAIQAAQADGELDPEQDAAGLATCVFTVLGGLRVAARRGATSESQRIVVEATLRSF